VGAPPTPEFFLAQLQNPAAGENDPLVTQFKQQLDALAPKCPDSRLQLANAAFTTHTQLARHGVNDSYLAIVSGVNDLIPAGKRVAPSCTTAFAAYYAQRTPSTATPVSAAPSR